MTLQGSGTITMTDVKTELGVTGTYALTSARGLFSIYTGAIRLQHGYSKSNIYQYNASPFFSTSGSAVILQPGFYAVSGSINGTAVTSATNYTVYPTSSTNYTLTAGGSTSSIYITVYAAASASLATSSNSINLGSSATLTPTFSAAGGSASISPTVGTVSSGTGYSVSPTTTTTYTLTASNGATTPSTATSSQTITVITAVGYRPSACTTTLPNASTTMTSEANARDGGTDSRIDAPAGFMNTYALLDHAGTVASTTGQSAIAEWYGFSTTTVTGALKINYNFSAWDGGISLQSGTIALAYSLNSGTAWTTAFTTSSPNFGTGSASGTYSLALTGQTLGTLRVRVSIRGGVMGNPKVGTGPEQCGGTALIYDIVVVV